MMVAQVVVGHGTAKEGRAADPIVKMLLIMLVTGVMTFQQLMTGITRSIQVHDKPNSNLHYVKKEINQIITRI